MDISVDLRKPDRKHGTLGNLGTLGNHTFRGFCDFLEFCFQADIGHTQQHGNVTNVR